MAKDDTPQNADFVQRIVGDADKPPETRVLTGWFGDSGKEGSRRLYTDAQLSNYVDIPSDAILHSEPIKDAQPAGALMVWVKADAQLDSGSAASRASRFLQGDLTKDLLGEGAQERGGFRCVTQVPCAEPTGFTGLCTKQPDVGGCWPCITAIPHCFEPTGFTGKCTHVPWPLPTRYHLCTVLHCPTFDLTCIPQICNAVATGSPGCVIEKGPGPQEKAVGAALLPTVDFTGCGHTKDWGLCQTQLLHCGGHSTICPTQLCAPAAGTDQAAFAAAAPAAGQGGTGGGGAGGGGIGTIFQCPTRESFCTLFGPVCPSDFVPCQTRQLGCTFFGPQCPTPGIICTQFGTCGLLTAPPRCPNPSAIDACPTRVGCPCAGGTVANPGGGVNQAAFGAAAPGQVIPSPFPCNASPLIVCNPSVIDACPTHGCATQPVTALCTHIAQACPTQFQQPCPTACGPDCQTQQFKCTQLHVCPSQTPICPSVIAICQTGPVCVNQQVAQPAVGAQAGGAGDFALPFPTSPVPRGCPPTPLCPSLFPQFCPQTVFCLETQVCPRIPHTPFCPQTLFCLETQVCPRIPHTPFCPQTVFCLETQVCPHIPHTPFCPQTLFCPLPTGGGPGCPTGIICQASPIPQCGGGASLGGCPSIACQQQFQQQVRPQQQQQFGAAAQGPTPASHCFVCDPMAMQQQQFAVTPMQPTPATHCRICNPMEQAQQQRIGITNFDCPTPNTACFVCPPDQFQAAQAQMQPAIIGISQFTCPTPATRCFICPQEQIATFYPCTRYFCPTVWQPWCRYEFA
jgi:hypothetical protein